ncbi:MAG: hypothetical protein KJO36_06050 [Acidimicrobiia bacterium]|nr:hypothetical protein [Acidimicrobiia bacterium]
MTESVPGVVLGLAIRAVASCHCCDVHNGAVWGRHPSGDVFILDPDYSSPGCTEDPDGPVWWFFELDMGDIDVEAGRWTFDVGYYGGHVCLEHPEVAEPVSTTYTIEAVMPCPGDFDGDTEVGITDLLVLLSTWGMHSWADLDDDGTVGFTDLLIALEGWGACSTTIP